MDEVQANERAVPRPLNPWFGRTRSTSAQAQSVASSSSAPAHPWTPLEPNSQPPLPPPLEPPSTSATAASSSQCPPQLLPHRRLPMGRRLPAPRRSSSRLLKIASNLCVLGGSGDHRVRAQKVCLRQWHRCTGSADRIGLNRHHTRWDRYNYQVRLPSWRLTSFQELHKSQQTYTSRCPGRTDFQIISGPFWGSLTKLLHPIE